MQKQKIDYKYNEDNILIELQEYIDKTYDQHYSHKNFQATEFVIDSGHGEGERRTWLQMQILSHQNCLIGKIHLMKIEQRY